MTTDNRTRIILHGQSAPQAGHGVRILWRCPSCERPWLQDARLPHGCMVRLNEPELTTIARDLQASLDDLPRATCRICTYAAGGELSIDQYGEGEGFGVSWEGAEGTHLLGTVFSRAWAERQREMPAAGIVTYPHGLRAVLGWLTTLPVMPNDAQIDPEHGALMALATPPGHGALGTEGWVWRGIICMLPCPPLGGASIVSLVEAMPPAAPWSRGLFTLRWRALAWRALFGALEQDGMLHPDEPHASASWAM
jgi:hypothetical protein